MKSKSKHSSLKRKHEFRYYNRLSINKRGKIMRYRHPAYIFLEKGNIFVFVTITHSNHVSDHIAIKLRKNPNPSDSRDAFYVSEIREDTKDRFRKRLNNWKIDQLDDADIQNLYKKR